jgi:hypothetical protein
MPSLSVAEIIGLLQRSQIQIQIQKTLSEG